MTDNYVALLGTKGGPAIRPGSSMPTSSLLCLNDHKIVVDCGLGVTRGLVDQGMQLKDLSVIFITHLHSDHYLELGPLIHTAWTAGLKSKVDVWGPGGLEAGMIWVNSENVRHLPTPFGGVKASGIGRDGGDWSFEFYMEQKHIGFATGQHKIARLGA